MFQAHNTQFDFLDSPPVTSVELTHSLFKQDRFDTQVGKESRYCVRMMKVRVYRNLNKPAFFSIVALSGEFKNKVIAYSRAVLLENCQYRVSAASRNRVLKERRRNVHAYCDGILCDASNVLQTLDGEHVTYNPYYAGHFFNRQTKQPQTAMSARVMLQGSDVIILD
jgi:hypothetical protein